MARSPTILIAALFAAGALGLAACGKKEDPRAASGVDRYPAGYPAGAPSGPVEIFRKPDPK